MSTPEFRVGIHRPTNVYVVVDPSRPEDDPQIGYIQEGWAQVLVDQANDAVAPRQWTANTTGMVVTSQSAERLRLVALLSAGKEVVAAEDVPGESYDSKAAGRAMAHLKAAVEAFAPYDHREDP